MTKTQSTGVIEFTNGMRREIVAMPDETAERVTVIDASGKRWDLETRYVLFVKLDGIMWWTRSRDYTLPRW